MKEEKKKVEIENELALPKEMPKRDEKIVNITYPDGSSCDVILFKVLRSNDQLEEGFTMQEPEGNKMTNASSKLETFSKNNFLRLKSAS